MWSVEGHFRLKGLYSSLLFLARVKSRDPPWLALITGCSFSQALAETLKYNKAVAFIDLSGSDIGQEGAKAHEGYLLL